MNLLFHQTLAGGRDRLHQLQVRYSGLKIELKPAKGTLLKDRTGVSRRGRRGETPRPDVCLAEDVL